MTIPAQTPKTIAALTHEEDTRKSIPGAELAPVMTNKDKAVKILRYQRNPDLDS